MRESEFNSVCYRTEQREEAVQLRNMRTGETAVSLGCTMEGATIQVRLSNGELDSWSRDECREMMN